MDALVELIATIPRQPLGTVVHVGAGPFARAHYEALAVNRLVLVDGDPATPDAPAALQAPAPAVATLRRVLAPAAGPLAWHRFDLPLLDGPLGPAHWADTFPRAAVKAVLPADAVTLQQLVEEVGVDPESGDAPNVLVLDLPGQELELLAATDRAVLRRFRWIALRSAASAERAAARNKLFAAAAFVDAGRGATLDPVWPVSLHRFDRAALEARQGAHKLAEAQQRIQKLEEELRRATESAATLQERLSDRDARQRALDGELVKVEAQLALLEDVLRRGLDA